MTLSTTPSRFKRGRVPTTRNVTDDDPLWFAVRDNVSLMLSGAMAVAFLLAWQI